MNKMSPKMRTETGMPSAIRERWSEWHAEERKWMADFRNAMRTQYKRHRATSDSVRVARAR